MCAAGLLILSLPVYTANGTRKGGECNFTKTYMVTLDLVKAQKPSAAEATNNSFLALGSDFREIERLVDPTIEPGPIRADYHETIRSMDMEDFNAILNNHAQRFTMLAQEVGETTEAGKMLTNVAQALLDMGRVFLKHMAVCEELARKEKGAGYTREDGIAAATRLFRLQKLKKELQPFIFLMTAKMNELSFGDWQKIIAILY